MSDESKPVRACLCYPRAFAEIKTLAQENGWKTVAEITAALGCGGGCGLCRPYLAKVLETGETAFAVLTSVVSRQAAKAQRERADHKDRQDDISRK
jgi:bacterioferritin-associated ferredoxin